MVDAPCNADSFNKAFSAQGYYAKTFGNDLINPHDEFSIRNTVNSLGGPVTIIDHGCGAGRAHYLYEELARAKPLHVIGFDISSVGIDNYRKKLLDNGYEENPSYHFIKGNNLIVDLLHRNHDLPLEEYENSIKAALGNVAADLAISEFGVISHIRTRKERVDTLRMLRKLTSPQGKLIATVPNRTKRVKETFALVADYETASVTERTQLGLEKPGDIIFKRFMLSGEEVRIHYHLYTPQEFQQDLAAGGWTGSVEASSILTERELSCRELRSDLSDSEWKSFRQKELTACRNLPKNMLEEAHYLLSIAAPKQRVVTRKSEKDLSR